MLGVVSIEFHFVVLGMCANPFDVDRFTDVSNDDNKPVLPTLDVEYHSIARQDTRVRVSCLDVFRASPRCVDGFVKPNVDLAFGV